MEKCSYCQKEENQNISKWEDENYNRFRLVINNSNLEIKQGSYWKDSVLIKTSINFCPMCGRKLK